MLIFILIMMIVTGVLILVTEMRKVWLWLAGMLLGSVLMILGFMLYFAKGGGLPYPLEFVFFIHSRIHLFFQYAIVTTDQISRILTAGRAVFLFFSAGLLISGSASTRTRKSPVLYGVAAFYALLNYVVFEPVIYARLVHWFGNAFHESAAVTFRVVNSAAVCATVLVLMLRLNHTQSPWLRKQLTIIFVSIANLQLFFLLFGVFSPLQTSYATAENNRFIGALYYSQTFSLFQWIAIIAVSIALIGLGTVALWKYNKLQQQIGKPDVTVEKKLKENNMGVRVFTHAIKNQLLAQRVLLRNIQKLIAQPELDRERLIRVVEELRQGNDQTLMRMDELYDTFKSNRMRFKPVQIREIYEEAVGKRNDPEQLAMLRTGHFEDAVVLADKSYLVQAVHNILSNAFDAVKAKEDRAGRAWEAGQVWTSCYRDGPMVMLMIEDNGVGIERKQLKNIFEPFYTRKNTNYNWGLGLSYVQQTVKAHLGYVRFESKAGAGTTFYVFIPIFTGENGAHAGHKHSRSRIGG